MTTCTASRQQSTAAAAAAGGLTSAAFARSLPENQQSAAHLLEERAARLRSEIAEARLALGRGLLSGADCVSEIRDRQARLDVELADVECMLAALPDFCQLRMSANDWAREAEIAAARRARAKQAEAEFLRLVGQFQVEVLKLKTAPERTELAARLWLAARATENQQLIGHAISVTETHHVPSSPVRERIEVIRTRERAS